MALIFIITVFLPKIAAAVDRIMGKKSGNIPDDKAEPSPERVGNVNNGSDPADYEVHSLFEASELDGWDPNNKIYNEDIYCPDIFKKNSDGSDKIH